jgi:hypothetical protein
MRTITRLVVSPSISKAQLTHQIPTPPTTPSLNTHSFSLASTQVGSPAPAAGRGAPSPPVREPPGGACRVESNQLSAKLRREMISSGMECKWGEGGTSDKRSQLELIPSRNKAKWQERRIPQKGVDQSWGIARAWTDG